MAGGRPTDYRPEYCQSIMEMGEQGMSVVEMAANLGVARNTLELTWPHKFPEFLRALTLARDSSQAYWERRGRDGVFGEIPGFQSGAYSRSMAARFPKDWTEKKQTELTGSLQVEQRHVIDPALLTTEQLEVIKQIGRQALLPPPEDAEFEEVED